MRPYRFRLVVLVAVLIFAMVVPGHAVLREDALPPALKPWQGWVLHGHESELCPSQYNDGAAVRCQWPARLKLEVSTTGGQFEQRWQVFAPGWVALPGNADIWPDAVTIDGVSTAVIDREGRPMAELSLGEHRIIGRFFWDRIPEMIDVPPDLGLLSLTIDGQRVAAPLMDARGRLWLQKSDSTQGGEERLNVQVFRLFSDTIPMQVTTLLKLDVSGRGREISLENIPLANWVPMDLESRLPVRMDSAGTIVVQARAGRWEIRVLARLPGPVRKIDASQRAYGDEIWSFQPMHDLRMVEIEGLPAMEPGQTEMPEAWRQWPAYLVKAGASMSIKELRRGDPDPAPDQLSLDRIWWLDFDGRAMTVHDRVSGILRRQWNLSMKAPMELGRVAVDGQDRVITRQGPDNQAGMELRRGRLDLQADARLPRGSGPIPALGWDHDFQQAGGVLNLPPGWRLLGATGVDQVSDSWLQRWSLLDFFLVLIIALAVFKLRSWAWGLTALVAMTLIFHEPGAPRLVWLHILAVLALLPLLPRGWIRRALAMWGVGAGVVLVVTAIPFMVHQIRWAVYPQLAPRELQVAPMTDYQAREAMEAPQAAAPMLQEEAADSFAPRKKSLGSLAGTAMPSQPRTAIRNDLGQQDPDALIPTGPGLPDWQWQAVTLRWNGPLASGQTMRLFLLSPLMNLFLGFLRVGLLAALIWGVVDWRPGWRTFREQIASAAVLVPVLLAVIMSDSTPANAMEGDLFPPPALLEELSQRLLEKPECLPYCADISRLELAVSDDQLQVILKVHAAGQTAIPLPVDGKSWSPDQILMDNAPISGLARDDGGRLWALVTAGVHTLILVGDIGHLGVLQIPLPLKPHTASFVAQGWSVKGIQPDGRVAGGIELVRLQKEGGRTADQAPGATLPAFLQVTRELQLGLSWQVRTTITRITPPGSPVVVAIPLLDGESVVTEGLQADQGQVLITLPADARTLSYRATLKITPRIRLSAPKAVPWTETWILDASPIWHCDVSGIAAIHHQDRSGTWQPQWQPWPGEEVVIDIQRPKAVDGQLVTIDGADLVLTPGRRFSKAELTVRMRTSRGGQHTLELPPKANLQGVTVNGRTLPIQQDGPYVSVPLQPGSQTIAVQWHQLAPFAGRLKVPAVKLGAPAVNARVSIRMPTMRWILLAGGPRWGPAVLFWSYLAVIVLGSLALGRIRLTPLKTRHWLLLGLGLTQIEPFMALIIVGWLLVFALRERRPMPSGNAAYNGVQSGLFLWTLVALACLFAAVKAGLVGQPEMQIRGNQSHAMLLNWTQDRIDGRMPQPWVFSLPVWVYRGLMLAWSLWLALALLRWLKWGWTCYSRDGVWRKMRFRKPKAPPSEPGGPASAQ